MPQQMILKRAGPFAWMLIVGFVIWVLIGQAFIVETVTIQVVDKQVRSRRYEGCSTSYPGGAQTCETSKSTTYVVVTSDEEFTVNPIGIYYQLNVGKQYSVVARGWKYFRYIAEVLEERKSP